MGKSNRIKKVMSFVFVLFSVYFLFALITGDVLINKDKEGDISYSNFMTDIEAGKVESVVFLKGSVFAEAHYKEGVKPSGYTFSVDGKTEEELKDVEDPKLQEGAYVLQILNPSDSDFYTDVAKKGVNVLYREESSSAGDMFGIILSLISILLPFAFLFYFFKMIKGEMGGLNGLSEKEGAKDERLVKSTTTFKDVAGLTEEKEELGYAISSLKNLEQYTKMGAEPIKGIIMEGPPGVGKTLLARAMVGEAGVNFLNYCGSDFVEMFVGRGAARIRKMFKEAEQMKPCIVFIDEFDTLGRRRGGANSGDRESDQTITALLERMDGIQGSDGILFIAATNRVEDLDSAVTRPGRFGKIIHVEAPRTKEDREAVVRVHAKNKYFSDELTIAGIAKMCYGLTGAEISGVLNEAVFESFKAKKDGIIDKDSLDAAIMKLYAKGLAKGKHNPKETERVAIHEVGHALMNEELGRKVIKVSVQPYSGGLGGVTVTDGESHDTTLSTEQDILDDVKVLLAGKVAEEIMLGNCSVGASNDLERATLAVKNYICAYGMKEGTLTSKYALMKEARQIEYDDKLLADIEEVLQKTYKEVKEYFSREDVKAVIPTIVEELKEKSTIYDVSFYCNDLKEQKVQENEKQTDMSLNKDGSLAIE